MARVTVRVIGEERLLARLRDIFEGMRGAGSAATREAAEAIRDRAQEFAPVDTGRLRDSIRVHRLGPRTYTVGPGDEVEYAEFVEYGTSVSPAQPYMRPALEEARRAFPRSVARRVRAEL